jgi:hypothetical protein
MNASEASSKLPRQNSASRSFLPPIQQQSNTKQHKFEEELQLSGKIMLQQ